MTLIVLLCFNFTSDSPSFLEFPAFARLSKHFVHPVFKGDTEVKFIIITVVNVMKLIFSLDLDGKTKLSLFM